LETTSRWLESAEHVVEHNSEVTWLLTEVVNLLENLAISGSNNGLRKGRTGLFLLFVDLNLRVVLSEKHVNLILSSSLQLDLTSVVEYGEALITMGASVNTSMVEVRVQQVLSVGASSK